MNNTKAGVSIMFCGNAKEGELLPPCYISSLILDSWVRGAQPDTNLFIWWLVVIWHHISMKVSWENVKGTRLNSCAFHPTQLMLPRPWMLLVLSYLKLLGTIFWMDLLKQMLARGSQPYQEISFLNCLVNLLKF